MVEVRAENDSIIVGIRRHRDGIKLNIQVLPEVEAFFEKWSGGLQERPAHGRLWKATTSPLVLWGTGALNIAPSPMKPYSLIHSGCGFHTDHGYMNISFLRIVGASRIEGVDVVVETVLGRGEISQLAQGFSEACNLFYSEYLQQVNMRAVVSVLQLPAAA